MKMAKKKLPADRPPIRGKYLAQLEEKYGDGRIRLLTSKYPVNVGTIPTGIRQLDKVTTVGGYPYGIVVLHGWESHGKTTVALMGLPPAQKLGPCGFIDAELSLVPSWAECHGVDLSTLTLLQPDTAEEGFDYIEAMLRSKYKLVILDSINSLPFKFELDEEYPKQTTPRRNYMLGKVWRKLSKLAIENEAVLLVISQLRCKVNLDGRPIQGSPTTMGGGRALPFYARMIIRIHRATGTKHKTKEGMTGEQTVLFEVVKNKVGEPFQTGETVISFDGTVRHSPEDYLEVALRCGRVIEKANNVFVVKRTGAVLRGRKQFKDWLEDSPKEKRYLKGRLGGGE
jgi:protein RecA